jgi:type IV pilus assembly protein PilA
MNVKSNSGFSLVELMVVVAIIGVLATVAVPNYLKFTAKAKQSNAKAELSGLYTAEKAFFVEYNVYHDVLNYIGFVPDGVDETRAVGAATRDNVARTYATGFNSAGVSPAVNNGPGLPGRLHGAFASTGPVVLTNPIAGATGFVLPTPTAFQAASEGRISNAVINDRWTINENGVMRNQQSGI